MRGYNVAPGATPSNEGARGTIGDYSRRARESATERVARIDEEIIALENELSLLQGVLDVIQRREITTRINTLINEKRKWTGQAQQEQKTKNSLQ